MTLRTWVHKTSNVRNALPKSAQPSARKALEEICNAEDRELALKAVAAFAKQYGHGRRRRPAGALRLPAAEHWIRLRTTNPIESTFATVRLRTKVTKGAGSRAAALAMVFKLVESAQARWRAVNAPHLVERPEAVAA